MSLVRESSRGRPGQSGVESMSGVCRVRSRCRGASRVGSGRRGSVGCGVRIHTRLTAGP